HGIAYHHTVTAAVGNLDVRQTQSGVDRSNDVRSVESPLITQWTRAGGDNSECRIVPHIVCLASGLGNDRRRQSALTLVARIVDRLHFRRRKGAVEHSEVIY